MIRKIDKNGFVNPKLIQTYNEIEPLQVLEDYMLTKGESHKIKRKQLDYYALISYGLSHNKTNLIYVGTILDKFFFQNYMIEGDSVKIPTALYAKCKAINDKYRPVSSI